MADVQIALVLGGANGAQLAVEDAEPFSTFTPQVLTLSGSSQQSVAVPSDAKTVAAISAGMLFWRLTPYGTTNCFAVSGANPTASGILGLAYPYGAVHHMKVKAVGDKLAVIQTS